MFLLQLKKKIEELVELVRPVKETKVDAEPKPKQFIKVKKTPFMEHFKNDMLLTRYSVVLTRFLPIKNEIRLSLIAYQQ